MQKNIKKDYLHILICFIISRVVLILITQFLFPNDNSIFLNFDIEHYYHIALYGYDNAKITAFFPAIPLIIRFFNLFGIPILGTMIFNNILALFSAVLLYKLTDSKLSAVLFICSPIAVFTFIAYTESLFIFLTLLTIYLYQKENYIWAGVMLGLGVMTRSLAAMLFFAIFIIMAIKFFKKELTMKPIFQMYIPATLISLIYPIYLQIAFGNWKLFMDVQFSDWFRISSNLISTVLKDIQYIQISNSPFQNIQAIYQFILLFLIVLLCIFSVENILKTKNEIAAICVLYLVFSILSIYSTCRKPELSIPSASYYRYFYGCISVYLLPTIFDSKTFISFRKYLSLSINIFLSIIFAFFYFSNLFMC